MTYEIGDIVYYKTLLGKEYYGKITHKNNKYFTIQSFNGYTMMIKEEEIIKRKE